MDVEQLHVVLQQSFSADATVRKPAEETIRNLKNLPGAVVLLLQVAAEKQVRSVFMCCELSCVVLDFNWGAVCWRVLPFPFESFGSYI
jgi:hypothetical protein